MSRREERGRCRVEIEQTPDSLHAHAVPEDVLIRPGDVVLVHDAPTSLPYNTRLVRECGLTVRRAGPLARAWTRLAALFSLCDLYEVGFETGEPPR